MVNSLRLVFVTLFAIVSLLFSSSYALADQSPTLVAGSDVSFGDETVTLATIAPPGNVFSGTLISRTAYYGWDTVLDVYIDQGQKLWVNVEGGDSGNPEAIRTSNVSFTLQINSANIMGDIVFDPEKGDLALKNRSPQWFDGTIMGMYAQKPAL